MRWHWSRSCLFLRDRRAHRVFWPQTEPIIVKNDEKKRRPSEYIPVVLTLSLCVLICCAIFPRIVTAAKCAQSRREKHTQPVRNNQRPSRQMLKGMIFFTR
ncbi:hypothetical protein PLICRDRAFT_38625 [Plicaturopsis crispa FD-325 SS-3]|nr:hypothetical protein PLICRDRAFT_38625 [Plicaturopsis crispa FD-325 SS-3]